MLTVVMHLKSWLCLGCIIGFVISNSDTLPSQWSAICQSELRRNVTYISCHVTGKHYLNFSDFRTWSAQWNNLTVSLNIQCTSNGNICLPWPYRAHHLDVLRVTNCFNKCYYSDYERPEVLTIPDTLRVLEENQVTRLTSMDRVVGVDLKSVPKAIDCGPLNLEVYSTRGTKAVFDKVMDVLPAMSDQNVTDTLTQTVRSAGDLNHICDYNNLLVYDVSQGNNPSVSSLDVVLVNSLFPELRTLNVSYNAITTYPQALKTYIRRLPKLSNIDLSHNSMYRFYIRSHDVPMRSTFINLTHNNIETIGELELLSFKSAIIDIRHNPLKCSCETATFTSFMNKYSTPEEAGLDPYYKYLWTLTCVSPASRQGQVISRLSSASLCHDSMSDKTLIIIIVSTIVCIIIVLALILRFHNTIRNLLRPLCCRLPNSSHGLERKAPAEKNSFQPKFVAEI